MINIDQLEALRPCPFCGGYAESTWNGRSGELHEVQCKKCGASSCYEISEDHNGNELEAEQTTRKRWNARVDGRSLAIEYPQRHLADDIFG